MVAINFRLIPKGLREFLHLNNLNKSPNKSSKLDPQRSDVLFAHVDGRCLISKGNIWYLYPKKR